MPKEELLAVVKKSGSVLAIARSLKYAGCSSFYKTLRQRCQQDGIDISHIPIGRGSNTGRRFGSPKTLLLLEEIMVEHSTYCRGHLKHRLIEQGILGNECAICGLKPTWNSKPLVLILDHKNGVRDDHRAENLRLLCPNCNSQQPTFSGRNKVREREVAERPVSHTG